MTAPGRVSGHVAIVTGAGSARMPELAKGIGESIAELLAAEGATVAVVDRDDAAAKATVASIRSAGANAIVVLGDLTRPSDCTDSIMQISRNLGAPSILVNNLGVAGLADSGEGWDVTMATNLRSHALMAEAFASICTSPAAIVNISSIAAFRPPAEGNLAYPSSKGGVIALTKALAVRYARRGIRVNCVCPGSVWTPIVIHTVLGAHAQPGDVAALREKRRRRTLLGTEGTGRDIANLVLFLASDEARWITAQTITVDGGALVAPF